MDPNSVAMLSAHGASLQNTEDGRAYAKVLEALIPYVSDFIDSHGGLVSLSLLANDATVKSWVAQIPGRFEAKLSKILQQYKDYFSLLEGGNVATYKGYEEGLIDSNGKIVKEKRKRYCKGGPNPVIGRGVDPNAPVIGTATAAGVAEDRMAAGADIAVEEELSGPDPLANIPVTDEMGQDLTLTDVLESFQQSAYAEDNQQFVQAFLQVRKVRNQTFGIDDSQLFQSIFGKGQASLKRNRDQMEGAGGPMMILHDEIHDHLPDQMEGAGGPMAGGPMIGGPMGGAPMAGGPMPGGPPDGPGFAHQQRAPRLPDHPRNTTEREERVQLTLREMAWQLYNKADQRMTVTELCQIPKIMHLKKGAVAKTTTFLSQHSEKFMVSGNEGGPNRPDVISLLMSSDEVQRLLEQTEELDHKYMSMYAELHAPPPPPPGTGKAKQEQLQKRTRYNNHGGQYWGK